MSQTSVACYPASWAPSVSLKATFTPVSQLVAGLAIHEVRLITFIAEPTLCLYAAVMLKMLHWFYRK